MTPDWPAATNVGVRALIVLGALCLAGCGDPDHSPPARDAATPDAGPSRDAGAPDAGSAPWACACEVVEDCQACFERIGACCYGDPTVLGQIDQVVENCERRGACSACCNECATQSCEALLAAHACPAGAPDDQH